MRAWAIAALAAAGITLAALLAPRRAQAMPDFEPGPEPEPEPEPEPLPDATIPGPPMQTTPGQPPQLPPRHRGPALGPLAVGTAAELAPLLEELDLYLGANAFPAGTAPWASAREVTMMPSAPAERRHAVPPREYWENLARTIRETSPLREKMGPLAIRAYRPEPYNSQVGGGKGSTHIYAAALDIRHPERQKLAREAARMWSREWAGKPVGLGIYGPTNPSNIHVDFGASRRPWRDTKSWLERYP